jgi:hypothetical protein
MNRLLSAALFSAALVCGASLSASAAPLNPAAPGAQSGLQKVHGDHRSCSGGSSWRHRHAWDGDRIRCGSRYYYRDSGPGVTLHFGTRDRHHWNRGRYHRRDRDRD